MFEDFTVTGVSPLEIQRDGDLTPLPFTPDTLIDPSLLSVDDRVRCELSNGRVVVHGLAGGVPVYTQDEVDALVAAVLAQSLVSARNRNMLDNGGFRTNQRGATSGTSLASNAYFLDRWQSISATNAVTWSATTQGRTLTIPSGKAIRTTVDRANAIPGLAVLSWEGTATARVYDAGGSAPSYAASPVLVTLTGSDNVRVEATDGTITNVQLERGSTPTPFERIPAGDELRRCQRRCVVFTIAAAGDPLTAGPNAGNSAYGDVHFPVTMAAAPTLSLIGVSTALRVEQPGVASNACTSIVTRVTTVDGFAGQFVHTSSATGAALIEGNGTSTVSLVFSCEF